MPQASILELERSPFRAIFPAGPRSATVPPPAGNDSRASRRGPAASGPGRLWLIERCGAEAGLTAAETQVLLDANIIIYERSLAPLVAELLPLGGYAEPAPASGLAADRPILARCLRFALDGWRVVQLIDARPAGERAKRAHDAARQLMDAGVSSDIPVRVVVEAACGGTLDLEVPLHEAAVAMAEHGVQGSVMMAFGPLAVGPSPPSCAFTANGLAG